MLPVQAKTGVQAPGTLKRPEPTKGLAEPEGFHAGHREQALELLRRGWPPGDEPRYDPDHALMLCRLAGFRPGLTLLYENMRLFREVLQVGPNPLPRPNLNTLNP